MMPLISFYNRGSVLILTLLVLFSLTLIESLVLSLSMLESKMTSFDSHIQQAQQAADAGLDTITCQLQNNMIAGKSAVETINELHSNWRENNPYIVSMGTNLSAEIFPPDTSKLADQGIISVQSLGKFGNARQRLYAKVICAHTGAYVLSAPEVGICGHYQEVEAENRSLWIPRGSVMINGSAAAFKNQKPMPLTSDYLHFLPSVPPSIVPDIPPSHALASDFMSGLSRISDFSPTIIKPSLLANFVHIANQEPDLWQISTIENFNPQAVNRPFQYISNSTGTLDLIIDGTESGWFTRLAEEMPLSSQPWDNWWQSGTTDNYPRFMLISPAALKITMVGQDFQRWGGYILLVSAGDIDISFNTEDTRARLVVISGGNIHLRSAVYSVQIEGSLNANSNIMISWSESLDLNPGDPIIRLSYLPQSLERFPYSWSLLGLGTVIDYRYSLTDEE